MKIVEAIVIYEHKFLGLIKRCSYVLRDKLAASNGALSRWGLDLVKVTPGTTNGS